MLNKQTNITFFFWLCFLLLHASFFELLLFARNANNVRNQVHMTLNTHIISRITNDYTFLIENMVKTDLIF